MPDGRRLEVSSKGINIRGYAEVRGFGREYPTLHEVRTAVHTSHCNERQEGDLARRKPGERAGLHAAWNNVANRLGSI